MNSSVIVGIATVIGAAAAVASYITQSLVADHSGAKTSGSSIETVTTADGGTAIPVTPKNVGPAKPERQLNRLLAIRQRIANWTRQKMAGVALSLGVLTGLIIYGVLYLAVLGSPQLTVSASCRVIGDNMIPGAIIRITYHINSSERFQVGLGAGIYDNNGK